MSNKFIAAIETVVIILLAVVILIYGQVLWQRYVQSTAATVVEHTQDDTAQVEGETLSEQQKLEVLDALKSADTVEVAAEEKQAILDQLSVDDSENQLTEEQRLDVLNSI